MKNILFVGSSLDGYFAQEVAEARGWGYRQMNADADIRKTTNDILAFVYTEKITVDIIIYDADAFINEAAEIASEIKGTAATINAKPVVYMPSFLPESLLAQELLAKDIKHYIFSGSTTDLKDQLEKNITGFFDANGRKEIREVLEKQAEARARIESFQTIGVAGCQERIGTTTQCMQIVKYLQAKGYRACYIEANQKKYFDLSHRSGKVHAVGFVEKYAAWTDAKGTDEVLYKGVNMYSTQGILKAKEEAYDYYVYDYGSITDRDFDRIAFLKDEIKILVAGAKPTEFDFLERILQIPTYAEASLIMSFVPEADQEDVLKVIADMENRTRPIFFAESTADPFLPVPAETYEKLIPVEATEEETGKKIEKKRKFFRRK